MNEILRPLPQSITHPRHMAIVGGSGSGKTTLARLLRGICEQNKHNIAFPLRILSRDPRRDDQRDENVSVGTKEFERLIQEDAFGLWWERPILNDTPLKYGFLRQDITSHCVFAGNDALALYPENVRADKGIYETTMLVQVVCGEGDRVQRLSERSPELRDKMNEWATRTTDNDTLVAQRSHYQVQNPFNFPEQSAQKLFNLIQEYGLNI